MKLNKLFLIGLATLAFAACSNDDKGAGDGSTSGEPTTMAIKIDLAEAKRSTETELGSLVESKITTAKVVIFGTTGLEVAADVTITTGLSTVVATTSGSKQVYVLVNAPALPLIDVAVGSSRAAFEKQILALNLATVTTDNNFFMTNITSPSPVTLLANITAPTTDNVVPVVVGRIVAKILPSVSAVDHVNKSGVLSEIEFKIRNKADKTYLIGQIDPSNLSKLNATPYSDGLAGAKPVANTPYPDYTTDATYTAIGGFQYVFENKNIVTEINEGNTTGLMVKGKFAPTVVYAADGITLSTLNAAGDFWAVYNGNSFIKYTSEDPSGASWAQSPALDSPIIKTRLAGTCYYDRIWIANAEEFPTPAEKHFKYAVVRNNVYKLDITNIDGIGSESEGNGLVNPIDPIEAQTEMIVSLKVLPWTVVKQPVILQ